MPYSVLAQAPSPNLGPGRQRGYDDRTLLGGIINLVKDKPADRAEPGRPPCTVLAW